MPRVYKHSRIVDTPPENKVEPPAAVPKNKIEAKKTEPPKTKSEPKKDDMETDPKALHKQLKQKEREISKIRNLMEKISKVIDTD